MDDLITLFFQTKYTEETQELLYNALGIFNVYTYADPYGEIIDLISLERNVEDDTIVDAVRGTIEKGIDTLVWANKIKLSLDVTLEDKIRLLEALFVISRLEDEKDTLHLFEGWLSDKEILAKVIAKVTESHYEDWLVMFTWVYDGTIKRLKEHLTTLKNDNEVVEFALLKDIRKNLWCFKEAFGELEVISNLESFNLVKGSPFSNYRDILLQELLELDLEKRVYVSLYIALLSSDGYENPKTLLEEEAPGLTKDREEELLFKSMLTRALGQFLPRRETLK